VRIVFISETWPPQVNGVALTLRSSLAGGLAEGGHHVEVVRPGEAGRDGNVGMVFACGMTGAAAAPE
jgi:hypothetical protein